MVCTETCKILHSEKEIKLQESQTRFKRFVNKIEKKHAVKPTKSCDNVCIQFEILERKLGKKSIFMFGIGAQIQNQNDGWLIKSLGTFFIKSDPACPTSTKVHLYS